MAQTSLVKDWEEAKAAAEAHWDQRGDLDQHGTDDGAGCRGGRCMECQYDACVSDTCALYQELMDTVGTTHLAIVDAVRQMEGVLA